MCTYKYVHFGRLSMFVSCRGVVVAAVNDLRRHLEKPTSTNQITPKSPKPWQEPYKCNGACDWPVAPLREGYKFYYSRR